MQVGQKPDGKVVFIPMGLLCGDVILSGLLHFALGEFIG
jgi:hypothetical protein